MRPLITVRYPFSDREVSVCACEREVCLRGAFVGCCFACGCVLELVVCRVRFARVSCPRLRFVHGSVPGNGRGKGCASGLLASLGRGLVGLDGCEVRLCDIRVPVCARVSRVSVPAPPGVFLPPSSRRGEALWERVEAGSGSPGAASSESAAGSGRLRACGSLVAAVLAAVESVAVFVRICVFGFGWMVVRFVRVIRLPACARVSRVSRVSRVCPGSPRCFFTAPDWGKVHNFVRPPVRQSLADPARAADRLS